MNAPEARTVAEPYVLNERDERGVVTLTLNRPQQINALSAEMMAALQAELDALARDDSARVIVLAARGKAFCPGHDLKQLKSKPSLDYYRRLFAQCSKLMLSLQRLPQPVIARVRQVVRPVRAGGLSIDLAFTLVFIAALVLRSIAFGL